MPPPDICAYELISVYVVIIIMAVFSKKKKKKRNQAPFTMLSVIGQPPGPSGMSAAYFYVVIHLPGLRGGKLHISFWSLGGILLRPCTALSSMYCLLGSSKDRTRK